MTTHFIQGRPASSLPCELGFSEVLNLAHLEPNEDLIFMYLAHSSMKILTFEFSCSMKMLLYKRRTLSPTLLDYLGLFLSCCLWWAKERLSGLLLPCQSPIPSEETPIKVLGPPILVLETELNEAFKISVAKKKKVERKKIVTEEPDGCPECEVERESERFSEGPCAGPHLRHRCDSGGTSPSAAGVSLFPLPHALSAPEVCPWPFFSSWFFSGTRWCTPVASDMLMSCQKGKPVVQEGINWK